MRAARHHFSDPALSIPSLPDLLRNPYRLTLAQALINGWTLQADFVRVLLAAPAMLRWRE
ncbi:MAG: hypothetical protein ACN6OS_05505 [Comamonas testosteroni]|uniref:hypothetical protein n=1 Tax=Comamonas testosteroni TaxID=285 RepID=UPI003D10263A